MGSRRDARDRGREVPGAEAREHHVLPPDHPWWARLRLHSRIYRSAGWAPRCFRFTDDGVVLTLPRPRGLR
jgi:hypothetical protein